MTAANPSKQPDPEAAAADALVTEVLNAIIAEDETDDVDQADYLEEMYINKDDIGAITGQAGSAVTIPTDMLDMPFWNPHENFTNEEGLTGSVYFHMHRAFELLPNYSHYVETRRDLLIG